MKKQRIQILVLLATLVLCIGGYFAVKQIPDEETMEEEIKIEEIIIEETTVEESTESVEEVTMSEE